MFTFCLAESAKQHTNIVRLFIYLFLAEQWVLNMERFPIFYFKSRNS